MRGGISQPHPKQTREQHVEALIGELDQVRGAEKTLSNRNGHVFKVREYCSRKDPFAHSFFFPACSPSADLFLFLLSGTS